MTTMVLLILIPGTSNLCDAGFIVNSLDVAPRYDPPLPRPLLQASVFLL